MIARLEIFEREDALIAAEEATWREIALIWEEGQDQDHIHDHPTDKVETNTDLAMPESIAEAIAHQEARVLGTTEEEITAEADPIAVSERAQSTLKSLPPVLLMETTIIKLDQQLKILISIRVNLNI